MRGIRTRDETRMMGMNFATRLSEASKVATHLGEAFKVTVCDPLCEVDTAMPGYVQSRARENGFVKYFRISRRSKQVHCRAP
jgi:hypothetical protein